MSMLGTYTGLFEEEGLCIIRPNKYRVEADAPEWYYNIATRINHVVDVNRSKLRGVIHCGSHSCPEIGCYQSLFGRNVIWIEANPESYRKWVKPCSDYWMQQSYNCAVSNIDTVGDIFVDQSPDTGSILNNTGQKSYRIPFYKLDSLIKLHNIDMRNFNFLNMDIEGAELKALEGMKDNLRHIDYLFCEAAYTPRQPGAPTFDEQNKYIEERGFELVKKSASFDSLGWGDCFYRRK